MRVHDLAQRAMSDPLFAAELAGKANRAARQFVDEKARVHEPGGPWEQLLREFAESPEELARLTAPGRITEQATTFTTITTTTTSTAPTLTFCPTMTTLTITTTALR